jgi:hypothetical protein
MITPPRLPNDSLDFFSPFLSVSVRRVVFRFLCCLDEQEGPDSVADKRPQSLEGTEGTGIFWCFTYPFCHCHSSCVRLLCVYASVVEVWIASTAPFNAAVGALVGASTRRDTFTSVIRQPAPCHCCVCQPFGEHGSDQRCRGNGIPHTSQQQWTHHSSSRHSADLILIDCGDVHTAHRTDHHVPGAERSLV